MAIEVMVVLIVAEVKADAPSASVLSLYVVSVLILLLGKSIPRADVVIFLMISAFGEIQADAVRADGARPPLSSTHYGQQRRCGAGLCWRIRTKLTPLFPHVIDPPEFFFSSTNEMQAVRMKNRNSLHSI